MVASVVGILTSAYVVIPPMQAYKAALADAAAKKGISLEQAYNDAECRNAAVHASDDVVDPGASWTNWGSRILGNAPPKPLDTDAATATATAAATAAAQSQQQE